MPSHIFLIGFMASGKSSAGRLLAERLGRPFVDLDERIETAEGATVPELFGRGGEAGFRAAEREALLAVVEEAPSVVACGGGVVLLPENRATLRLHGTVVLLDVSSDEAVRRLGKGEGRPLLAGDPEETARRLMAERGPLYRSAADIVVPADLSTPERVSLAVEAALSETSGERPVRVEAPNGSYEVVIGRGLLERAGERLREQVDGRRAALITDEHVRALYGSVAVSTLEQAGFEVSVVTLLAGEGSKTWATAGRVLDELARSGLDRRDLVVALGGGVVGDLAGFCAATYMRGVRFAQLPTTLLAQVDSAIGGKTGVDLEAGKNLAGAFWQPVAVLEDVSVLATLPAEEWRNGLAEVAKTAVLSGEERLAWLEANASGLADPASPVVPRMVADAVAFKAAVVSADEREAGLRECLNYGHTLGHAIENALGYGTVPHGVAIAEGMRFAARLAEDVLGADAGWTGRQARLLDALGLPRTRCRVKAAAVRRALSSDKKARGGEVRFVLTTGPGRWQALAVGEGTLEEHLRRWVEEASR